MEKKIFFDPQLWAVIDLGTNTTKLSLAKKEGKSLTYFKHHTIPVFLGKRIENNIIQKDAEMRLFDALDVQNEILKKEQINPLQTLAVATSAFRNAINGYEIALKIRQKYGWSIEIISGEKEAQYICEGVKQAFPSLNEIVLLMDIGGGSVEFILTNGNKVFWKKSFEIGATRLKEKYHRTEPISDLDLYRLMIFLEYELATLREISFKYAPRYLIGSAGTFETLAYMHLANKGNMFQESYNGLVLSMEEFDTLHQMLINSNYEERLNLAGLVEFRAEMIVVAVSLLRNVLLLTNINKICISEYALKEGYLQKAIFLD
jgi:exopolyphosphatase/guanosine-5'-triphosphate,3'-diphosphate pyrophosphatase